MSTTTIRLPENLKARVARAAERSGTSAHSFILEAIAEKADHVAEIHEQQRRREERRNSGYGLWGKTVNN